MDNKISPINKDLEARLEIALRRSSTTASSLQTTFVFRPGTPSNGPNVYTDFATLYAALLSVNGPKILQFDDTFAVPVIPVGTYDFASTVLSGLLDSGTGPFSTQCFLEDGVIFLNLESVVNMLTLITRSTTVPVYTFTEHDIIVLEKGSTITNDPASTVPFFSVPLLVDPPIIAMLVGGGVGSNGGPFTVNVDAGAQIIFVLDIFAALASNVVTGPGTALALVTSQAAFLNTPFPISQPAVGALAVMIFQFANFISFQGLNPANWVPPPPDNVEAAINRMASLLVVLNAGPIP